MRLPITDTYEQRMDPIGHASPNNDNSNDMIHGVSTVDWVGKNLQMSDNTTRKSSVNVLVLDSIFHEGGAEKITYDIVKRLNEKSFNVFICALYRPGPWGDVFIKEGYHFEHGIMKNKYDLTVYFELSRIIRRNKIQVLYIINQPLTLFWAFLMGKRFGLPVVSAVHNTFNVDESIKLKAYTYLLPRVDAVVAVAERQRQNILDNINIEEKKLVTIYNGVDADEFRASINIDQEKEQLGLQTDALVVGIIARLDKVKGIEVFLSAAQRIIEQQCRVNFLIVGDGPEMEALKALAQDLNLGNKVIFAGYRTDINVMIQLIDIAVLSSYTEALPISILEYMISSKPIVSTNVGSIPEVIEDQKDGLLVNPGSADELASAIRGLIDNPEVREKLGKNAKRKAERDFSIEKTASETGSMIERLADNS